MLPMLYALVCFGTGVVW